MRSINTRLENGMFVITDEPALTQINMSKSIFMLEFTLAVVYSIGLDIY